MSIFLKNQGLDNGIHSIKEHHRRDIDVLIKHAQSYENKENLELIDAAARLERFLKLYEETETEDSEKEKLMDMLTADQEEKLREAHAMHYNGTDDNMADAHESWLEELTSDEMKKII